MAVLRRWVRWLAPPPARVTLDAEVLEDACPGCGSFVEVFPGEVVERAAPRSSQGRALRGRR